MVVEHFFPEEKEELDQLRLQADRAGQDLEAFVEEHGVEDGLLQDVVGDNGKVTKKAVTDQIKELSGQEGAEEELEAAERCKVLLAAEATHKKAAKEAEKALGEKAIAKAEQVTESEIRALVAGPKWFRTMQRAVHALVASLSDQLCLRIALLDYRYAVPLPQMLSELEDRHERVFSHLELLGGRK